MLYYAMERFLWRVSKTRWVNALVVKGGLMLRVWDGAIQRPTRDIDLHGKIDSSPDAIRRMVADCLAIPADDCLVFASEVSVSPITVQDGYPGAHVAIDCHIGKSVAHLRLDIGVSDDVVPDPAWIDYPTLLGDESPRLLAYRPTTAIAEKFEAMVDLGLANSRLKDYGDIWMLSRTLPIDGAELVRSIRATFAKRGTPIPAATPPSLTVAYANQPHVIHGWESTREILRAGGLNPPDSLVPVLEDLEGLLMPAAMAARAGADFGFTWVPGSDWDGSDSGAGD